MWTGETRGAIPDELRQEWEDAVVGIGDDEFWLEEILASSPPLAVRWLEARIENDDWRALWNRKNVQAAASTMDDDQRLDMLRRLPEHFYLDDVTATLIGDSDDVYRQVLREPALNAHWKDPLKRSADDRWRWRAGIALDEGRSPQQVARATMLSSDSWSGPESAHLQAQIDDFNRWLEDPDNRIQQVANLIIAWLAESRERALADERREAIEGLR
jgi:hypothetical protein